MNDEGALYEPPRHIVTFARPPDVTRPFRRGVQPRMIQVSISWRPELVNHLQVLCVGRHRFLAEHFARYFAEVGVDTCAAVGVDDAVARARGVRPDVVVCEYDLLVTHPLDAWEGDEVLRHTPLVAVSLTRRPTEVHPLDASGVAGFLYLPTLHPADARKLLHAAASRPTYTPGAAVARYPVAALPADVP